MRFKQEGTSDRPLKFVNKFTYLGSNISSTESNVDIRLAKTWNAINLLSIMRKSDLAHKIKRHFFQAVAVSILLYGFTTWTLTKRIEKKFDGNYTRMLYAVLNKSYKQHPTKQQLYSHLPPISQNIQAMRGTAEEVRTNTSNVLLWTPTYGCVSVGRQATIYISSVWTLCS